MADSFVLDKIPVVGDLQKGRPTLGNTMSVSVYRLMIYSLRAALTAKLGKEKADQMVYLGGKLAGEAIHKNMLKDIKDEEELFE